MDELWEMMTLAQTGKMAKNTLILIYGRKYWDDVLNLKAMVRWGMINQNEFDQLQFADTVDEAFEVIRTGLEKYHMEVDPFLQAY
jgi:predicted Rossmann-fold nucleotide-binding protein